MINHPLKSSAGNGDSSIPVVGSIDTPQIYSHTGVVSKYDETPWKVKVSDGMNVRTNRSISIPATEVKRTFADIPRRIPDAGKTTRLPVRNAMKSSNVDDTSLRVHVCQGAHCKCKNHTNATHKFSDAAKSVPNVNVNNSVPQYLLDELEGMTHRGAPPQQDVKVGYRRSPLMHTRPLQTHDTPLFSHENQQKAQSNEQIALADAMQSLAVITQQSTLPKSEILMFSGNPKDYYKFIMCFETNIASKFV